MNLPICSLILLAITGEAAGRESLQRPIVFEPDGHGAFVTVASGASVRVEPRQIVFGDKNHRILWKNSAAKPALEGLNATGGVSNYAASAGSGGTPVFRSGIPHFQRVFARNLYRGIDVIYYGNGNLLEFDLTVHPGADLKAVQLVPAAGRFLLNPHGDAEVQTPGGVIRYRAPIAFQTDRDGARARVTCAWQVHADGSLGLEAGPYDQARVLIVDPILEMMTYLGGDGRDVVQAAGTDADGNLILAGTTLSLNFPGASPSQQGRVASIFVTKLNPAGTQILFTTLIGARVAFSTSQYESVSSLAVGGDGSVYLTGSWILSPFPATPGAWQADATGGFAVKLDTAGRVSYSTLLGSTSRGLLPARILERDGIAYIAGNANAPELFGTPGVVQRSIAGGADFFALALTADGSAPLFLTALGGSANETLEDLAFDPSGNLILAGSTLSADFPVPDAPPSTSQTPLNRRAAVLARLDPLGRKLLPMPKIPAVSISGLELLPDRSLAIVGATADPAWLASVPVSYSHFADRPGEKTFVAKFGPDLQAPEWVAEIGTSSGNPTGKLIADGDGNLFWTGPGSSVSGGSFEQFYGSLYYLLKISADGSRMLLSSPMPSASWPTALARLRDGKVLAAGAVTFTPLPVTSGAVQPVGVPSTAQQFQFPIEDGWASILDFSSLRDGNIFAILPDSSTSRLDWRIGQPLPRSLQLPLTFSGDPGDLVLTSPPQYTAVYTADPKPVVTIAVNPSQTEAGQFAGSIAIASTSNPTAALYVPLTINVRPRVTIALESSYLEFHIRQGQDLQTFPTPRVKMIKNFGGDYFNLEVRSSNPEWFNANAGSISDDTIGIYPNIRPAGVYEGTVAVRVMGLEGVETLLRVKMIVDPPAVLSLSRTGLITMHVVKGQPVVPVTVQITSTVPGSKVGMFIGTSRTWFRVTSPGNTAPTAFTISVDSASADPGVYSFSILVEGEGSDRVSVPVSVTVSSGSPIDAVPRSIALTLSRGAASAPPSLAQVCFVTPTTGTTIQWSVDKSWVTPTQGTAASPFCLFLTLDGTVAEGVNRATLTARAGAATASVPITWEVYDIPKLQYPSTPLTFRYQLGGPAPPPQFIPITVTTLTPGYFYMGQNSFPPMLLNFDPPSGQTPASVKVIPLVENLLSPGTYATQIAVGNQGFGTLPGPNIPVTIEVLPDPNLPDATVTSVRHAATMLNGAVAPGQLVSVTGTGLGPATRLAAEPGADGLYPMILSGRSFFFNDLPARVLAVSGEEALLVVPSALAGNSQASVTVEISGKKSKPLTVRVDSTSPGLISADGSGVGRAAVRNLGLDGRPLPDAAGDPVAANETVVLYATGLGAFRPAPTDGSVNSDEASQPVESLRVRIGGREATVLKASPEPGLVSAVIRIEARVPAGISAGPQSVLILAGENPSQPGITVMVR